MNPKIIGVKEATKLGPGSVPVKVLSVTWTASAGEGSQTFGPFTEDSTWQDLNSGALLTKLQTLARNLGNLPTAS